MLRGLVVALGVGVLMIPGSAEAGKLSKVRSQVRGSSSRPPPSSPPPASSRPPTRATRAPSPRPTYGVGYVVPQRRVAYRTRTVSDPGPTGRNDTARQRPTPTVARYGSYPYEYGNRGYVKRLPRHKADERDHLAGQVQVEGGYAGGLVWRGGGALTLNYWRLGLRSDLTYFIEQQLTDAMYLGATHATFNLVMREHMVLHLGPGVSYMVDGRTPLEGRREYAGGISGTVGIDVVPAKPIVLSGRFDFGRLYKAPTMLLRGQIGFLVDRWELYAAYEYRRIGTVALLGPIAGVRAWF